MKKHIIAWLGLMFFTSIYGQDSQDTDTKPDLPPGPPVVLKFGDFASWEVTVSPASDQEASARDKDIASAPSTPPTAVQNILYTRTKNILRVETSNAGVPQEDRWIFGPIQIVTTPVNPKAYVSRSLGHTEIDYTIFDLPELKWVSRNNYDNLATDPITKRKVRIFKYSSVATNDDGKQITSTLIAKVDPETRLPISFQKDNLIYTYKIDSPPSDMLVVPSKVKTCLSQARQSDEVLHHPPPRP